MQAATLIYNAIKQVPRLSVFPLVIPERADYTLPYAVYTPVSSVQINTIDGITHNTRERMQVDVYHSDFDELLQIHTELLDALDSLPMSDIENSTHGVDDGLYRLTVDVLFNATTKQADE